MIANLKAFGFMDEGTANSELKRSLAEVKRTAELLLNLMDLMMGRVDFEPGEIDKIVSLRQAILDFRSVEVNPSIPQRIVIDPDNMKNIEKLYGAITDQSKNTLINDMMRDYILNTEKKLKADHLNAKCRDNKAKLQKALDMIGPQN